MLQEPGSYVGEVVKVMGKKKVLVKVRRGVAARARVFRLFQRASALTRHFARVGASGG